MRFRGRNIEYGDRLYDMDGNDYFIDNWSPATGDVYIQDRHFNTIRANGMDLSWHPPYIRRDIRLQRQRDIEHVGNC